MAGKYLEIVNCKGGFIFINPSQDGIGMSGFLPLNLQIFKEEEVLL